MLKNDMKSSLVDSDDEDDQLLEKADKVNPITSLD